MSDLMSISVIVIIIIVLLAVFRSMRSHPGGSTTPTPTSATRSNTRKAQIVEDIKSTQTSRMVDAISILEELSKTSPNYRQYTELIGTTQPTSSVTAPYSKRQVAYYDLRCFRIENIGGQETETLIAHEKSIEPFYFNDGTSEEHVYVDLASFGDNVILVNSANRIEGPESDFAKALDASARNSSAGPSNAYAIVGELRDKAVHLNEMLRGLLPQHAYAFAGISGISMADINAFTSAPATLHGAEANYTLMSHGHGGPRHGGPGPGFGGDMGNFDFGSFGNLDSFLGGMGNLGNIGGPRGDYWRGSGKSDAGDILLGMGLGALLSTLATSASDQYAPVTPQSQFRGYRIVEDVIPLNYQVYALGEIYKNGTHVTMGKSTSTSYPSSFFAAKPEAEVISHLNGK